MVVAEALGLLERHVACCKSLSLLAAFVRGSNSKNEKEPPSLNLFFPFLFSSIAPLLFVLFNWICHEYFFEPYAFCLEKIFRPPLVRFWRAFIEDHTSKIKI